MKIILGYDEMTRVIETYLEGNFAADLCRTEVLEWEIDEDYVVTVELPDIGGIDDEGEGEE